MKKLSLIHPFVFSLFPVFFLYAKNANQVAFQDIILPLVIVTVSAVLISFLFFQLFKEIHKSTIMTSALILFFFSFGHLTGIVEPSNISGNGETSSLEYYILGLGVLILLSLTWLLLTIKKDMSKISSILFVISACLFLFQIIPIANRVLNSNPEPVLAQTEITPVHPQKTYPDIYYIILDGYGRNDILKDIYHYDNSAFLNFLENKGFYIGRESRSNYAQTLLSMASSLNLNYCDSILNLNPQSDDYFPAITKLKYNRVLKELKKYGYKYAAFATGYDLTEFHGADLYLEPGKSVSGYINMLIQTTPIPLFLSEENSPFAIHRQRIKYILKELPNISQPDNPCFILAHIVCPHPPFVFGKNGEPIQDRTGAFNLHDGSHYMEMGGTVESYREHYRNQITYFTGCIQNTITEILEKKKVNPPIIIVQGDHGPGSELNWENPALSNVRERFSILNAYFLPGTETDFLYPSITPVNSFRLVMNKYFDASHEILPDHSYFSSPLLPYLFFDVTSRLDSAKLETSIRADDYKGNRNP